MVDAHLADQPDNPFSLPIPLLAKCEWIKTYVVPRLFGRELCARIAFDFSDRRADWLSLVRAWRTIWRSLPHLLITVVGIDDPHLFAIADFVDFVSEFLLVISLDNHQRFDQPGRRGLMNLLSLPGCEGGEARRSSKLSRPIFDRGKYIIFDVPPLAPDTHGRSEPYGRSDGLSEGNALMFVNELFRLGRSLRVEPQRSRDWVRRFCFDWRLGSGRRSSFSCAFRAEEVARCGDVRAGSVQQVGCRSTWWL